MGLKHYMKNLISLCFLLLSMQAMSQSGIIKGKASIAINNDPVLFANVVLLNTDMGTTTDIDGNYIFEGVPPGLYDIQISYLGFKTETKYEIQVLNNRPSVVDFEMVEDSETLDEITIKAAAFKKTQESPVSLRNIGVNEIKRRPGGNRDISLVIQSLPGVTSTANFRNDLIIRGGSPNENRFYLDGVEVPNINHFATQGASGGPAGIINVDFIREVDFYSGAFPSSRGNTLSSVFDFKQKDGRDDRLGYTATVGAQDLGITVEGPIGEKVTFLASARRSYLQFLFKQIGLPFLPIYNDFQAKVKYKPNNKEEWTFVGLGAVDNFELNLDGATDETGLYTLEFLPVNNQWSYTNGLVYKRYQDNGYTSYVISRNMLNNESFKYKDNDESSEDNLLLRYNSQEIENKLRIEQVKQKGDYRFLYGLGTEYVKYNTSTFNRIFTANGPLDIDFDSALNFAKYYAFGQVSKKWFGERLSTSFGFRMDGNSYSEEMFNPLKFFSPRFSASYGVNEQISVNFNTGLYYQLPAYTVLGYEEDGALINKQNGATFIEAGHIVAGLEFNTLTDSRITVEGFYKDYSNYPFLLRDSLTLANLGGDFGVVGNEPSVPTSDGRSYGLEFLFQQRLYKGFYGILAYTLGWSEFEDKNGALVPSSWDSRHIVNATIGKSFKKDWEAGINWRFQSGLPFTPDLEDSNLVINWDRNLRAIPDYDRLNTLRGAPVNSMDIRVDKKFYFDKWSLNLYLDLRNISFSSGALKTQILDRPLGEDGLPIGEGVIIDDSLPLEQQRYLLKSIEQTQTVTTPSVGVVISI